MVRRCVAWSKLAVLSVLLVSVVHASPPKEQSGRDSNQDAVMDFFKGEPDQGYPEPALLLTNATGRNYQSLNGLWDIILDEAGMSWRYITAGEYFADGVVYPETGMRLLEQSFDSRNQLQVPGDWNSQRPDLDRYRSRILYSRVVEIQPEADKKYFLHFGGANYTTDLFLNDQLVGRHIGGYTSFNFDITAFIKPGKNRIIVRVDAHLDESTIPTMRTSDFWKYGGLIGDVGLISESATYVAQYQIYLHDQAAGEIKGWLQLAGDSVAGQLVMLSIDGTGIRTAIKTDAKGRGEFTVRADKLSLWSPQSPHLYDVQFTLAGVSLYDRIGFRTVRTDGVNILLNGKPVQLRGISMHQETTRHPGLSSSRDDVLAQFRLVKELNANFVRLAHYSHNEHTVRLADEMGLMLWSEVPIVSLIDWSNPDTLAAARGQVTDNVSRDRNRASVIMWSVSNESFPQSQARLDFLAELASLARELDSSKRPIASALFANPVKEFAKIAKHVFAYLLSKPDLDPAVRQRLIAMAAAGTGQSSTPASDDNPHSGSNGSSLLEVVVDDPLGDVVDIVGYNEYFGWYYAKVFAKNLGVDEGLMREAMFAIMPNVRFSNAFGKPMIVSEFGASAKAGLRSKEALLWSEEYQAKVYRAQLEMLAKSPGVQGFSPWVLKDFRSHLRELNGIQDTYNRKGLVSETGQKKLAFTILADFYRRQAVSSEQ